MRDLMVTKSTGDRVPFSVDKVRQSMTRAGADPRHVETVLAQVMQEATDGISTKAIYDRVCRVLTEHDPGAACRYGLRDALMRLGPAGFHFEEYIAELLAAHGYKTELPEEFQGSCVKHEVDVVAHKDGKILAIEAKFRNTTRDIVHLKDVMATYARYLDLLDGAALGLCPRFAEFWILTNSVFSDRAETFGKCKGLKLIGWNHPRGLGLAHMIDKVELYPVTILPMLTAQELTQFARAKILLCKEMLSLEAHDLASRTDISQARAAELLDAAGKVMKE